MTACNIAGNPIEIPHIPNPTREQVAEYHAKYIKALEHLYNDNMDRFEAPTTFHGKPIPPGPIRIVA
jgi:hypothetical protein